MDYPLHVWYVGHSAEVTEAWLFRQPEPDKRAYWPQQPFWVYRLINVAGQHVDSIECEHESDDPLHHERGEYGPALFLSREDAEAKSSRVRRRGAENRVANLENELKQAKRELEGKVQ